MLVHHVIYAVHGRELTGAVLSPMAALFVGGHTGVTLFFVLSGYLISRPFLAAAAGGRTVRIGGYLERRALRILPLYVAAVLLASALLATRWSDLLRAIPHLLFLSPWAPLAPPLAPFSGPWWSLSTEVQFYLALPAIAWLLRRGGRVAGAALALGWLCAYVALLRGSFGLGLAAHLGTLLALPGRAPAFAVGAALAWVDLRSGAAVRRGVAANAWLRAGGGDLALAALVLALGFLLRAVVRDGFWASEVHCAPWHVLEAVLWGGVLGLLRFAPLRLRPLLVSAPLLGLGRISYSLYLVHFTVIPEILLHGRDRIPAPVLPALLVLASLGAAWIAYVAIERPSLRWKRRIAA